MAVETLTTPRTNLPNSFVDVTAREVDFVTRFAKNWTALQEVLGISRPIKKAAGTKLVSYTASVNLESGAVNPGAVIPYSKATVTEIGYEDLTLEKYAKAVTIEDVDKYGVQVAVEKTDDAFLDELQADVLETFFTKLSDDTYAMTASRANFQKAVAAAIGLVKDKFKKMRKNASSTIVFVNTLDAYDYLGDANISIQTMFGIDYVEKFLGADVMILSSEIEQGSVIALPADNLVLYYVDPSTEFSKLGLVYTTDGVTNLIGFHAQGNYGTAVGESFALKGMKLWYEFADGVAIVSIDANSINGLTVESETDAASFPWTDKKASDMQTDVSVSGSKITGTLKFIEGGLSPAGPLAGDGYFIALKWSNPAAGVTSLKVGLQPSASGMDLVECIDDLDRNGVFKISSGSQKLVLVQSNDGHKTKQVFDLSGLTFEEVGV